MIRRGLIALLLVVIATGAAIWLRRTAPTPRPKLSGCILLAPASPGSWQGIDQASREGLMVLLEDCLEVDGDVAILDDFPLRSTLPVSATLQISGSRVDDRLELQADISEGGQHRSIRVAQDTPAKTLLGLVEQLGIRPVASRGLVLQEAGPMWELLRIMGGKQHHRLGDVVASAGTLAQRYSGCASLHLLLGISTHRQMLWESMPELDAPNRCESHFRKGLELCPHHPRGVRHMSSFMADRAQHREAMELLFASIKAHPRAWRQHSSLAYAARSVGLLDGARRALRQRDRIIGSASREHELPQNTTLYAGDWEAFEMELGTPEISAGPLFDFYRGYIRLLQGRRDEARPYFLRGAGDAQGAESRFQTLCRVYSLALDGRRKPALSLLGELRALRAEVRIPDGEFTFKLAEAFNLLGEQGEALDMAVRARTHGFTCTPWFERTPLLRDLRELPRWKALIDSMKERQAFLERQFPPERFGPPA